MQRKKTKNFIIILASLFVIFLMINGATAVKITNNTDASTTKKIEDTTTEESEKKSTILEDLNPEVIEELISKINKNNLNISDILPAEKNGNNSQPLWHPDLGCPWILFIPITVIWIAITAISIPTGIYIPMFLITWIASIIEEYNADNWYQFGVPFFIGLAWPILGWMISVSLAYQISCDIYENIHGI